MDAARTLRGLTQAQLSKLFVAEGFGRYDIGRIERGVLALTRARRRALVDLLRVPDSWFTDEDLDLSDRDGDGEATREVLETLHNNESLLHELLSRSQKLTDDAVEQAVERICHAITEAVETRDLQSRALNARLAGIESDLGAVRDLTRHVDAQRLREIRELLRAAADQPADRRSGRTPRSADSADR
jgi:transcriptional regulator with XRE-family HTH domain